MIALVPLVPLVVNPGRPSDESVGTKTPELLPASPACAITMLPTGEERGWET
jgi:hypothetical protein